VSVDVVMVESSGRGGWAQYTHFLCEALVQAGVRPYLVTRKAWEMADHPRAFAAAAPLAAGQPYATSVRAIARIVRDLRPPIVHVQGLISTRKDGLLIAWLRHLGPRVVVTAHNAVPHDGTRLDRLGHWGIYRAADHVIAHNEATRRALVERFHVSASRLTVIPLGDFDVFAAGAPGRGEARARLGLRDEPRVVVFFGAIRPYKGLDVLLEALPRIRAAGPGCRLLVAGEPLGGDLAVDRAHAERLGVGGAVSFTERYLSAGEVACHVRAADVAVFPYRRVWESASIRVAIALGCPVVASDTGGLGEVIRDGDTGRLVPPGDSEALARAVIEALGDPAAAAARAGRALDEEHRLRSWRVVAERTAARYRRLATATA
jgi:glycosyltransferase involved in cell wall biosynthesis